MDYQIGQEALLQRGESPLFKELTDILSNYLDAVEQVKTELNTKYIDYVSIAKKTNLSNQISKAILKYTNLPISDVIVIDENDPNAFILFQTKKGLNKNRNVDKSLGYLLQSIANRYDDKKSYLDLTKDEKNNISKHMRLALYMTSGLFKLTELKLSNPVTAHELAAIVLHEVGHVDGKIRYEFRSRESLADTADLIDYIKTTPDTDNIIAILDVLEKNADSLKSWKDVFNTVNRYFRNNHNPDDKAYTEALSMLATILIYDLSDDILKNTIKIDQNKDYDQYKTMSHRVDVERTADDWAVRNGTGPYLISFFSKIDKEMTVNMTKFLSDVLDIQTYGIISQTLNNFKARLDVSAEQITGGYDSVLRRMELIVETQRHAFSDHHLPSEVKSQLIDDIKRSEAYIHDYQKSDYRKDRLMVKRWLDSVSRFKAIIASPFISKLDIHYHNLQEATRSLSKNPLYYLANKD